MLKTWISRWGPALLIMIVIFTASSRPSDELPDFGSWDYLIKKSAHAIEFGLLALAYWRGFNFERDKRGIAWALAVCYAITDEVHQSYVPGRHPAVWDVLVFDNLGAILALTLWDRYRVRRQ